jgi:hypothetical protein
MGMWKNPKTGQWENIPEQEYKERFQKGFRGESEESEETEYDEEGNPKPKKKGMFEGIRKMFGGK